MTPKRIQRKRTKGWRMPPNTKSVTRPGKWGNNYIVKSTQIAPESDFYFFEVHNRKTKDIVGPTFYNFREAILFAVEVHREHIVDGNIDLSELTGLNLACFCPLCDKHKDGRPWNEPCEDCPPCHADVLLELANAVPGEKS